MEEIIVTLPDIHESTRGLDTEYREALADALAELKFLSDTPLKLMFGTDKQKQKLKDIYNKPLTGEEIRKIINYISDKMKGDFQYDIYRSKVFSLYSKMADNMSKK